MAKKPLDERCAELKARLSKERQQQPRHCRPKAEASRVNRDDVSSNDIDRSMIDSITINTLIVRVQGGGKRIYEISSKEKHRLWEALQQSESDSWVVFDTATMRVAINQAFLMGWQFCHDYGVYVPAPANESAVKELVATTPMPVTTGEEGGSDKKEHEGNLRFYFSDGETWSFIVEPDEVDEEDFDEDDEEGPFQWLFTFLDLQIEDGRPGRMLNFQDQDGEMAFIDPKHVAVVEADLYVVKPGFEQPGFEERNGS